MGSICGVLSQSVSIAAQNGPINHPGELPPNPSLPSQQRPHSARPRSARPRPALLLAVQSPAPLRERHNGAPAAPPPDARLGDPAPPRPLRLSGSVLEVGLRPSCWRSRWDCAGKPVSFYAGSRERGGRVSYWGSCSWVLGRGAEEG